MRWVVNIWECLSRMFYDYHKTPGVLVSLLVCFWFGLWFFLVAKVFGLETESSVMQPNISILYQ